MPRALTSVLLHLSGDSDVINVCGGCGVKEYRTMQPSVVEEVKVYVLDKVTLGIPGVGGAMVNHPCLGSFDLNALLPGLPGSRPSTLLS
jgi:hypothetical protein